MADDKIRISKVMANRGMCSRREADRYIEQGWVHYGSGQLAELGVKVDVNTKIELDPRAHKSIANQLTVLLNKPVGYVSGQPEKDYVPAVELLTTENHSSTDRNKRKWRPADKKGLAPAGRLDIDSQGLLVLTQNGSVARTLIGPESNIEKEYLVRINGIATEQMLQKLRHGLSIDGRTLKPARIKQINPDQLQFILQEGMKRQIRRMCDLVGLDVVGLKRVRIGRVQLGKLEEGKWRYLGNDELF